MVDRVKFKNVEVPRLGLGSMRLPCKTPIKREANPLIDYDKAQQIVDMAYENGVNYFDTAYLDVQNFCRYGKDIQQTASTHRH